MVKDYAIIFLKFIKKSYPFLLLFVAYVGLTYAFHLQNCLCKLFIGYPCPGCGMTRAFFSLIQFNIPGAFRYNPLIFILPVIAWIIIFHERPFISKLYNSKIFWLAVIGIVLLTYILRFIYVYPEVPMDYYKDNLLGKLLALFA